MPLVKYNKNGIDYVRREYLDIDEIISCTEMK